MVDNQQPTTQIGSNGGHWTISNQQQGSAAMVDNQQPTTRIGSYCGHWTNQQPTTRIGSNGGQSETNKTDWQLLWTISIQQQRLAAMVDTGQSATNKKD